MYPTHTPDLAARFATLNQTRVALDKAMRASKALPFTLPEYKASKVAYRLYWAAVDADKAASKPTAPV